MPYGVGFDRFRLERDKREISECETAFVDPNASDSSGSLAVGDQQNTGQSTCPQAEVTALSCRYTFNQDPNSTDPRLLPPPKRTLVKPIRDGKNVRNMRLRPRKVLCSNCKQGIHDNSVKGNTTTAEQGKQCENANKVKEKQAAQPTLKMTLRGKRKAEDNVIVPTPKRPRKQYLLSTPRVSPVIKISFTSPQGEVHTSKLLTSTTDENEKGPSASPIQDDMKSLERHDYKKMKKAWKKARIREKAQEDDSSKGSGTPPLSEDESGRHHKKSKRNKHKKKHRHRSLSVCIPQEEKLAATFALNNGGSDFENDSSRLYREATKELSGRDAKALDSWDGCDVLEPSHPRDNSRFKENSVNLPKQHIQTRLNQTQEDQATVESSSYDGSGSIDSTDPGCISDSNIKSDDDMPLVGDQFPTSESEEQQEEARVRPLMMRIQTKNVSTGSLPDGRSIRVGDVVWGKIHGFPWWPGKILCITVSQRDNGTVITQMAQIAWCGSSTMSHMPCSELYPFLEDFKYRYNKKKKGSYKNAIKEATRIAQFMMDAEACATPDKTPVSDKELECEVEVLKD